MKYSNSQYVGKLGEDIASRYLLNKGFAILCRNYRKKYGEIDIIAKKDDVLHFVEVKSVSRENVTEHVSCETNIHRPEDNVHHLKLVRLSRTIQAYLAHTGGSKNWVFDLIAVKIDVKQRKSIVSCIENIVL